MENDFCNKCGKCCKQIKVDFENKILFFDGIQILDEQFKEMLVVNDNKGDFSYCCCKYLKNNICENPEKPEICRNYPSSPFAFLPENCGFEGKVFLESEKIKYQIRKYKEEVIHYTALLNTVTQKGEKNRLEKIIHARQSFIDKYKEYGSEEW